MRDYKDTPEIEEDLLQVYANNEERRDASYEGISREGLIRILHLKSKTNDLFRQRADAARDVIDLLAKRVGIDPHETGFWLYALDFNGDSPIVKKMEDYFSRSGDKVKLKKRIEELENENRVLRSLLKK